jgi:hypothetical protein
MKTWPILLLLCCTVPGFALGGEMQKATVHSMRKVPCMDNPGAGGMVPGMTGVIGVGSECTEYELRTTKVSYVIQPRRSVLLLAGGDLLLHTSESVKDIRCDVLSMSLLSDVERKENQSHAPPMCVDGIGRVVECPLETRR